MQKSDFIPLRLVMFALLVSPALPSRSAVAGARVRLADSIKEIAIDAPTSGPHRVRDTLTAAELAESLNFVVSLRMRNFDQFQSIVQSGRTIPAAEMEVNYLPLKADYDRVAAWLVDQGFTPTLTDARHTNLFFRGTVGKIAEAMDVSFARVAADDGEFTSATTAPSLPEEFASVVLGIDGLQPHIRMHAPKLQPEASPEAFVHPSRAIPADALAAYHVPANLDGTGQTIAIFADALPLASDLVAFYQDAGINKPNPGFTAVLVNGGPIPGATLNEVTLDTEWSTGIAPGANLRVYAGPTGGLTDFVAACTQILNDGIAKIVSSSFSNPETALAPAAMQSCSQLLAQMAAAGISVFHGAGDSGSYGPSAAPEYPTTDPYVTALSGTTMTFDANWNETGETVWPNTGGGFSTLFARPAWQFGPGVPAGTMRCVPDAAAPSSMVSSTGLAFSFVVLDGATNTGIGGSSLTGPVWAGLTAIINQSRTAAGLPLLGLLSPKIYPLIGTSAFHDITVGSDGAYSAGPGYDLCSGVGSPNVTALIQALAAMPVISVQPSLQTIASGTTVVFNLSAGGAPTPTYQWFLNGGAIAGATSSTLVVTAATAANAGSYTCVATNSTASVASAPATLTVIATGNPGRLINLSVNTRAGKSQVLTVGFVSGGGGTSGTESLLIRATGPALANFGVTNTLADPTLSVLSGSTVLAANDNWGSPSTNQTAVTAADNATGAFALTDPTSLDAAVAMPFSAGADTVQVSGNTAASGTALAEVYDNTANYTLATPRLINLSAKNQIAAGGSMTAGFVVYGATSKTVLIRATGPALVPFGVTGSVPDPQIALHTTLTNGQDTVLATNAGWGGDPQITTVSNAVGAFALTNPASADSVVLRTLAPGSYTAIASSVTGVAGTVLIEVYEVP